MTNWSSGLLLRFARLGWSLPPWQVWKLNPCFYMDRWSDQLTIWHHGQLTKWPWTYHLACFCKTRLVVAPWQIWERKPCFYKSTWVSNPLTCNIWPIDHFTIWSKSHDWLTTNWSTDHLTWSTDYLITLPDRPTSLQDIYLTRRLPDHVTIWPAHSTELCSDQRNQVWSRLS